MSLSTELNEPLLTEAGEALLAENETSDSGSGDGGSSGGSASTPTVTLHAQATLTLAARASLTQRLSLRGKAELTLDSTASLTRFSTLKAKATLSLTAKQMAENTIPGPSGLNALMKIITDPHAPTLVLDQYLLLWFYAHPSQCQVSLQIDDEAESQPAWAWENPGNTQPAILKIDSAEIPGDGLTHRLNTRVRYAIINKTSAPSIVSITAKITKPKLIETPEWCGATLIRQGTALLHDLTEVHWRHPGAVKIIAKYKILNTAKTAWIDTETIVGYADYDEDACFIEGIGVKLWTGFSGIRDVTFGVAAISKNQFGLVQWAANPIGIQPRNPFDTVPEPVNPDAATAVDLNEIQLYSQIYNEIRAQYPQLTNWNLTNTVLSKLKLRIKDITRKGGAVTLDDLGRFEARWNTEGTKRSVAFSPSIGFKEGTKQGRLLTDAEARA